MWGDRRGDCAACNLISEPAARRYAVRAHQTADHPQSRFSAAAAAVRRLTGREADGGSEDAAGATNFPSYRERLRRYRLLIGFVLTSVVMIFVSFTTAYVVRKAGRGVGPGEQRIRQQLGAGDAARQDSAGQYVHPAAQQPDAGGCAAPGRRRRCPGADRGHSRHSREHGTVPFPGCG